MAPLNEHHMENKVIDSETPASPPEGVLAIKHLYSAAILESLIKPVAGKGKLDEEELNRAIQELLPGPAERILMKN
jgi:hypothetical protein